MGELAEWDSFYVILGSAAGALIGLQFVVMTLIADRPPARAAEAGAAFATPTIVHFTMTLCVSALVRVPWHSETALILLCAAVGIGGAGYQVTVLRSMKRQEAYRPEFEDWLFHLFLPLAGYLLFIVAAIDMDVRLREGLLLVAGAVLLLLLVGIHNAWDAVSYHVLVQKGSVDDPK
jgi:hypothetical protein